MSTLGIPYTDVRFVKDGKTVYSNLLSFFDGTAFKHLHSDFSPDLMATEQCFYALSALKRFEEGKTALFDMSDVSVKSDADDSFGLQGKDESVKKTKRGEAKVFSDVSGHYAQKEIEELSARGIIIRKSRQRISHGIFIILSEQSAQICRTPYHGGSLLTRYKIKRRKPVSRNSGNDFL